MLRCPQMLVVVSSLCAGGCGFVRLPGPDDPEVGLTAPAPFAAATIDVHPLTRVGDAGGTRVLELYLETRDAFGDVVKAPGRLTVLVYQSGSRDALGGVEADRTWQIDLTDPAENSRYFDAATRLYRVRLAGIPSWLREGAVARIDVKFETFGPEQDLRTLRGSRLMR